MTLIIPDIDIGSKDALQDAFIFKNLSLLILEPVPEKEQTATLLKLGVFICLEDCRGALGHLGSGKHRDYLVNKKTHHAKNDQD